MSTPPKHPSEPEQAETMYYEMQHRPTQPCHALPWAGLVAADAGQGADDGSEMVDPQGAGNVARGVVDGAEREDEGYEGGGEEEDGVLAD